MNREYYIIVNLDNLTYMKNGVSAEIDKANKFETLEQAQNNIKLYDKDFNGAIYKVEEYITREYKKMEV